MDRMFFIVNPVAGSGKCNALFSECETILRERGIEYIVKKTEYKGHAVKIAEEAIKNGEKFIIAAGGDGTVNPSFRNRKRSFRNDESSERT